MADSAGNWCLIESDPGVFSEIIRELGKFCAILERNFLAFVTFIFSSIFLFFSLFFVGCEGVQVEELWSLDEDSFKSIE